jgi:hypothetical protein
LRKAVNPVSELALGEDEIYPLLYLLDGSSFGWQGIRWVAVDIGPDNLFPRLSATINGFVDGNTSPIGLQILLREGLELLEVAPLRDLL